MEFSDISVSVNGPYRERREPGRGLVLSLGLLAVTSTGAFNVWLVVVQLNQSIQVFRSTHHALVNQRSLPWCLDL